jgi:hypothetical protein
MLALIWQHRGDGDVIIGGDFTDRRAMKVTPALVYNNGHGRPGLPSG